MSIYKGKYGQWLVSDVIDGRYVSKQYYDYTKKEALALFEAEYLTKEG